MVSKDATVDTVDTPDALVPIHTKVSYSGKRAIISRDITEWSIQRL